MSKIPAENIFLYLVSGSPVKIGQLKTATTSGLSVKTYDTTDMDDEMHTHRGSRLPEGGSLSAEINFDPGMHSALVDLIESPAEADFLLTDGEAFSMSGAGWLTKLDLSGIGVDQETLTGSIEIKWSGLPEISVPEE